LLPGNQTVFRKTLNSETSPSMQNKTIETSETGRNRNRDQYTKSEHLRFVGKSIEKAKKREVEKLKKEEEE
jgi:hypothetical protein